LGVHGYRYRRIIPDLFALALVVTALVTAALTLIGHLMFDISENGWMYLFFGLIVVGAASLATLWLRAAGRAMAEEAHD
jgi:FtsH-binding integral membrane protein